MRAVTPSFELRRIVNLPRREHAVPPDLADLLTEHLKVEGGTAKLFPLQAFALSEAHDNNGLLGCVPVGGGKTLISLLAPVVIPEVKRPLLMVPAQLRTQLEKHDIPKWSKHFKMHSNLTIVSYSIFQREQATDFLETLQPDLIILDEAHMLKNKASVRTGRFLRYMKSHPETKLVALSGTMFNKSLFDFWEFAKQTIKGEACPLPRHWNVLKDWDACLGADQEWSRQPPLAPGALLELCTKDETPRQGFRRRLLETSGVVASLDDGIDTPIVCTALYPKLPDLIKEALEELRKTWTTPSGDEIDSPVSLYRAARQLACGFYYRWVWPDGKEDNQWLDARADWHKTIRRILKRARAGMDSPLLVFRAASQGMLDKEAQQAYATWLLVKDRFSPTPPVEAIWLSDFAVKYAAEVTIRNDAILWYEHEAVGNALLSQMPVFGAGKKASTDILTANGPIAASISAHGTGKNLQHYNKNVVFCPMSSGSTWQQLMGRTHRPGQQASQVEFFILQHTEELITSMQAAMKHAPVLEQINGYRHKLLLSTNVNFVEPNKKDVNVF